MKNLVRVALIALPLTFAVASAKAAGRAGCGSDNEIRHSVQFGWDDAGKLTDVTIYRQDDPKKESIEVHKFDLNKDHKFFEKKDELTGLTIYDNKGHWVALTVGVDEAQIGKGELSWGIAEDGVKEKEAPATCSFAK